MTDHLDENENGHLREQARLSARSGLLVVGGATLASLVVSRGPGGGVGTALTAFLGFAVIFALGFAAVLLVEPRTRDGRLALVYGASSWLMMQTVIGITNQFPALASIGPMMMGILPVSIALFARWRPVHQTVWCASLLLPLALATAIPVGRDVWPLETRLAAIQALVLGSVLSIVGIRVLDDGRRLVRGQAQLVAEAHASEHHALDELRRSERRYREIVELSKEGIWVADAEGRTTLANTRAGEILGYPADDLIGRNMLEALDPDVTARIRPYLGADPPAEPMGDVPARRRDGSKVWLSVAATRLLDDAGRPFGYLSMFTDVSHRHQLEEDLRQSNQQLDRLAYLDALTGLPNRRALDNELGELHGSRRQIGVLMIDIDHFKLFNDVHGHPAGDRALEAVAAALTSALRPDDSVYRYGGEEFLILVQRATDRQALIVAQRARAAVAALRLHQDATGQDIQVTVSVGVATGQPEETPMATLIKAADGALYRAKADGRDRVVAAASPSKVHAQAGAQEVVRPPVASPTSSPAAARR